MESAWEGMHNGKNPEYNTLINFESNWVDPRWQLIPNHLTKIWGSLQSMLIDVDVTMVYRLLIIIHRTFKMVICVSAHGILHTQISIYICKEASKRHLNKNWKLKANNKEKTTFFRFEMWHVQQLFIYIKFLQIPCKKNHLTLSTFSY